jgi:hypothetical protein
MRGNLVPAALYAQMRGRVGTPTAAAGGVPAVLARVRDRRSRFRRPPLASTVNLRRERVRRDSPGRRIFRTATPDMACDPEREKAGMAETPEALPRPRR